MGRTPVVELDAEVLERMEDYVAEFAGDLGLIIRRYWAGVYLQGLFLDGERNWLCQEGAPLRRCRAAVLRHAG